jgi:hypothetical protein
MASTYLEPLELTDEERSTLASWPRRPKSAQALALRRRMVLACASERAGGLRPGAPCGRICTSWPAGPRCARPSRSHSGASGPRPPNSEVDLSAYVALADAQPQHSGACASGGVWARVRSWTARARPALGHR